MAPTRLGSPGRRSAHRAGVLRPACGWTPSHRSNHSGNSHLRGSLRRTSGIHYSANVVGESKSWDRGPERTLQTPEEIRVCRETEEEPFSRRRPSGSEGPQPARLQAVYVLSGRPTYGPRQGSATGGTPGGGSPVLPGLGGTRGPQTSALIGTVGRSRVGPPPPRREEARPQGPHNRPGQGGRDPEATGAHGVSDGAQHTALPGPPDPRMEACARPPAPPSRGQHSPLGPPSQKPRHGAREGGAARPCPPRGRSALPSGVMGLSRALWVRRLGNTCRR